MSIPITICGKKIIETKALLDTGAGGKFIDQNFVRQLHLKTQNLESPIKVYNVDGTPNKQGTIRKYAKLDITINGRMQSEDLLVTGLGKQKIILGFPWFKEQNPDIDWKLSTLTWRNTKQDTWTHPKASI